MPPFTAPSPIATRTKTDGQLRAMCNELVKLEPVMAMTPEFVVEYLRSGAPGQKRFALHVVFRIRLNLAARDAQEVAEFSQLSEEDQYVIQHVEVNIFNHGPEEWDTEVLPLLSALRALQNESWNSHFRARMS